MKVKQQMCTLKLHPFIDNMSEFFSELDTVFEY